MSADTNNGARTGPRLDSLRPRDTPLLPPPFVFLCIAISACFPLSFSHTHTLSLSVWACVAPTEVQQTSSIKQARGSAKRFCLVFCSPASRRRLLGTWRPVGWSGLKDNATLLANDGDQSFRRAMSKQPPRHHSPTTTPPGQDWRCFLARTDVDGCGCRVWR